MGGFHPRQHRSFMLRPRWCGRNWQNPICRHQCREMIRRLGAAGAVSPASVLHRFAKLSASARGSETNARSFLEDKGFEELLTEIDQILKSMGPQSVASVWWSIAVLRLADA